MIYPEVFSFAQSSLYYAFKNSDGMGQGIVILLFVFSVFTWTLMLERESASGARTMTAPLSCAGSANAATRFP